MIKKTIITIITLATILGSTPIARAAAPIDKESSAGVALQGQDIAFLGSAGFNDSATVGGITSSIISIFLGFLGIIFIGLLIYGGFIWMTASGNEEQAKKAMGIIKTAVIGLIIIVSAYSITFFVFDALNDATGGNGGLN